MARFLFRNRLRVPPSWCLIAALGVVFFWMNNGTPAERHDRMERLHLSSYETRYCDLSAVLAWMDLDHQGVDTRFQCPACPCAPTPMNYGAGVLWLGRLGLYRITASGVNWVGPLVVCSFLAALAFILTDAPIWATLYCAVLLFSPPVFLALERGNLDILIFALVAAAAALDYRLGNAWGYFAVLAAGALKYYPIAAGVAFWRTSRRGWIYFGGFLAAAAVFLYITRGYMATAQTPDVGRLGWGYSALPKILPAMLKSHGVTMTPWSSGQMFLPVLGVGVIIAAAAWRWRLVLGAALGPPGVPRTLFLAGAALYAACFAVSSNYEYRSVFLLMLAPQLFPMVEDRGFGRRVALAGLALQLPAFTLSWFRENDAVVIAHQLCYWLLFFFCGTLVAAGVFAGVFAGGAGKAAAAPDRRRTDRLAFVTAFAFLAAASVLYWVNSRSHGRPRTDNLVENGGFTGSAARWTLGSSYPGGCRSAEWGATAGHPGAVILNSCGEKTGNPFAAQRITGLIPGRTYIVSFDWAEYDPAAAAGFGTGKSFAVFIDLAGAAPNAANDMADRQPVFTGERLNTEFAAAPPISFVAMGTAATIYFEAELDARTPGGPGRATDIAYAVDNVDVRMKP